MLAAVTVRRRQDPQLFWAAGFFGITLLPASNLLATTANIMAERFLYLPSIGFVVAVVALVWRLARPRVAYAVLGAAIVLCATRTMARNPAWANDVTLGESGIASAPGSFRTHELLARGLFRQDRQRNIDRAIHEAEIAWSIIRPVAPEHSFYETPANLGMYYLVKGEAVGGPSTTAGRAWYEKAAAMLETAAGLAKTAEKSFNALQQVHGKPAGGRVVSADLFFNLGAASTALGRWDEAIEAYRYAKGINPSDPQVYDGLCTVYLSQGNMQQAAIVLEEKTQVDGFKPATMSALAQLYAKLPGGSCAVVQQGTELKLDPGCPKAATDLCVAWADLAQSFVSSRQAEAASFLKERSVNKYNCPAEAFANVP
jgi:tetratricopeptide (TPR) repeat protein